MSTEYSREKMVVGRRSRIKIHRLTSLVKRQVTYSKRKAGLIKKAAELSILCDIDIALLTFSPGGRPTLFTGVQSNFTEVLNQYFNVNQDERRTGRVASIDLLQKIYHGTEHQVDRKEMLGAYESVPKVAQLNYHKQNLEAKIVDLMKKLEPFERPDCVDNPIELKLIEETMINAMDETRKKKETLNEERGAAESELLGKLGLELSLGSIGNFTKAAAENKNSKDKEMEK